jgi:hypothetical protein
MPPGKLD